MYRSLFLIGVFLFFSAALPCVCLNELLALSVDDSCGDVSLGMHMEDAGHGAASMNLFDHISSWRDFFSLLSPAVFFVFLLTLLSIFGQRKEGLFQWSRVFEWCRILFRPPEYPDARAIVSYPLLHAFYSGVLHAKISY